MLILGFLDGFFFSFFLLFVLFVYVACRITRVAFGNPLKAIGWIRALFAMLNGGPGQSESRGH